MTQYSLSNGLLLNNLVLMQHPQASPGLLFSDNVMYVISESCCIERREIDEEKKSFSWRFLRQNRAIQYTVTQTAQYCYYTIKLMNTPCTLSTFTCRGIRSV